MSERIRAEPIATRRLVLEPLKAGHASEMSLVLADPELHRFTGGKPATLSELQVRYTRLAAGPHKPGVDWLNWVLQIRNARSLVGTVQATVVEDEDRLLAYVAWVVGVPWQGCGFAKEAACAMICWLQAASVERVVAHIHPAHAASAAIARAAGLVATGETHDSEAVWRRPAGGRGDWA